MPWIIGIILFFAILNWIFEIIGSIGTVGWSLIGGVIFLGIVRMIWNVERKRKRWVEGIEDALYMRQDQISDLILSIVQLLDEMKPFVEMTHGESGQQIKEIDRQVTRLLVDLNEFLEEELKQPKNWKIYYAELAELLKKADQQYEDYSDVFHEQKKQFEHIAETERQVLEHLRTADQAILEAEQALTLLQDKMGSSLLMIEADLKTAREWLDQGREIRYKDPLRAQELAEYTSKKSRQLLQDIYDMTTFDELAKQLPQRLESVAQQLKQDQDRYGLRLPGFNLDDEIHYIRSSIPQLHQFLLEGNSLKSRHLWHNMEKRLNELVALPATQLELKEKAERQITAIRKQMERMKQEHYRLNAQWSEHSQRYVAIYGNDIAEAYTELISEVSKQVEAIDQARRLNQAEKYTEALDQLRDVTYVLNDYEKLLLQTEQNLQALPRLEQQQQLEQLNKRYQAAHDLNISKLKFMTRTTLQNNHQRFNYEIKQFIEEGSYEKAAYQLSKFSKDVEQLEQL